MDTKTDKSVNILGANMKFTVSDWGVHLICDKDFYQLMEHHPIKGVELIALAMKREYKSVHDRVLNIHPRSIEIEIWGHYFFEILFVQLEPILEKMNWDAIRIRLDKATDVIDCAEWKYDNNRWLWDVMIPFYTIIKRAIPL